MAGNDGGNVLSADVTNVTSSNFTLTWAGTGQVSSTTFAWIAEA